MLREDDDRAKLNTLVNQSAGGDAAAFASLHERLAPAVGRVVIRVVRDPDQADEVSQEVFAEVWRKAASYDAGLGSAQGWVCTIARRRAIDRVRSEQAERDRRQRYSASHLAHDLDPTAAAVADPVDRARLHQALQGMTTLQRQAIVLTYFRGHTCKQAARVLGVPTPTLKTRVRDGVLALRAALPPSGREDAA